MPFGEDKREFSSGENAIMEDMPDAMESHTRQLLYAQVKKNISRPP
jgi:hypothetical protein